MSCNSRRLITRSNSGFPSPVVAEVSTAPGRLPRRLYFGFWVYPDSGWTPSWPLDPDSWFSMSADILCSRSGKQVLKLHIEGDEVGPDAWPSSAGASWTPGPTTIFPAWRYTRTARGTTPGNYWPAQAPSINPGEILAPFQYTDAVSAARYMVQMTLSPLEIVEDVDLVQSTLNLTVSGTPGIEWAAGLFLGEISA